MNKEKVTKEIQSIAANNILLELPTSFGKTKQALDLMAKRKPKSVLIIVPRLFLIDNWKDEFIKWGFEGYLDRVKFSTYVGLKKFEGKEFDLTVMDECHHLTEKCRELISTMTIKNSILLSATVTKDMKLELNQLFSDLYCYHISAKGAIDNGILPDPKVFVIPYSLDNTDRLYPFKMRESKGKSITCNYADKWKYLKDKSYTTVILLCTQKEYITEISSKIDYWKRMYMRGRNDVFKNKWLYLAGLRLKMLGTFKNAIITNLQVYLKNYRSLTFCNSIEQTEILGSNCINSKNKDSAEILSKFNKKTIKHITACNILNEGMNLTDCQVGIYASLNSSEIMIKQKLGRLLRHPNPVLIIPYYKGTREEEILQKMIEDYNPELITEITNLNKIKI